MDIQLANEVQHVDAVVLKFVWPLATIQFHIIANDSIWWKRSTWFWDLEFNSTTSFVHQVSCYIYEKSWFKNVNALCSTYSLDTTIEWTFDLFLKSQHFVSQLQCHCQLLVL
jgi:hypothetical protein